GRCAGAGSDGALRLVGGVGPRQPGQRLRPVAVRARRGVDRGWGAPDRAGVAPVPRAGGGGGPPSADRDRPRHLGRAGRRHRRCGSGSPPLGVKVGVSLPQFRPDAEAAIVTARAAEAAGLDGVFVFDHLWPLGQPDRPVLQSWALLGALAAETGRVDVGPLVARVGLVPDAVLNHQFETLHRMVGARLIGGVGTGDRLSRAENVAFGVDYPSVEERLAQVAAACRHLRSLGARAWVGGRSAAIREVAAAEADGLNVWESTPDEVRTELA